MATILIVSAGGVVAHKCAQLAEVFQRIVLASRTESKCKIIADQVAVKTGRRIEMAQVDADNVPASLLTYKLMGIIQRTQPARMALS